MVTWGLAFRALHGSICVSEKCSLETIMFVSWEGGGKLGERNTPMRF